MALVAVGVVLLHRLADDAGALAVLAAGREIQVVHGHQDAPLAGFQAVAHVRQSAIDDRGSWHK